MRQFCSFCGRNATDGRTLIANPVGMLVPIYICEVCVDLCIAILNKDYDKVTFYDEMASALFPDKP